MNDNARFAGLKEKDIKVKPVSWFPIECDEVVGKMLKFTPPERVYVVGSHAEGGCFNVPMNGDGSLAMDVAVEMPGSFFQEIFCP